MSSSAPRPAILVLLGVAVVAALFMFMRRGGGDEGTAAPPPAAPSASSTAPAAPGATSHTSRDDDTELRPQAQRLHERAEVFAVAGTAREGERGLEGAQGRRRAALEPPWRRRPLRSRARSTGCRITAGRWPSSPTEPRNIVALHEGWRGRGRSSRRPTLVVTNKEGRGPGRRPATSTSTTVEPVSSSTPAACDGGSALARPTYTRLRGARAVSNEHLTVPYCRGPRARGRGRWQRRWRSVRRPRPNRLVTLSGGRVADATFDAEGCGAVIAAGSACMQLIQGAHLLDAARVGSGDIERRAGRALAGQAACGRPRGRRASPDADKPFAAARISSEPVPRASGGRRQRRGGQRGRGTDGARRGARRGRRHAQALGRPRNRRDQELLLAAGGRVGARPGAFARPASPDARPRGAFSLRSRRRLPRRARSRPHAEPVRALQWHGPLRRHAGPGGPPGRGGARDGALRADLARRRRPASGPRRRPAQGPGLHAVRRSSPGLLGRVRFPWAS